MVLKSATADRTYPIWLLKLVPPGALGRPLSALLLGVTSAMLFWWGGVLGAPKGMIPTEAKAAALYFCFLVAYLPATLHFIVERSEASFDRLAPLLPVPSGLNKTLEELRHSIRHKTLAWLLINLCLGILLWLIQSWFLAGGFPGMQMALLESTESMMMALGPLPVWMFTCCAIGAMVNNATLFRRLAGDIDCDVFNTDPLMAFGSMAVSAVLLVIGLQASFSIMWLGGIDSPWAITPGLAITMVAMIYLLLAPITPLHRRISDAKVRALGDLQQHIDAARGPSFDAADPVQARKLADLLTLRREITGVREWPFAMDVLARLGLYLVIVPLTWVGAALIEMLVSAMLE